MGEVITSAQPLLEWQWRLDSRATNRDIVVKLLRALAAALNQPLAAEVPKEARKLKNGISFLEDRGAIRRARESLIEGQFRVYLDKLAFIASPKVDVMLDKWRHANEDFSIKVSDGTNKWNGVHHRLTDIRSSIEEYADLWYWNRSGYDLHHSSLTVVRWWYSPSGSCTHVCAWESCCWHSS